MKIPVYSTTVERGRYMVFGDSFPYGYYSGLYFIERDKRTLQPLGKPVYFNHNGKTLTGYFYNCEDHYGLFSMIGICAEMYLMVFKDNSMYKFTHRGDFYVYTTKEEAEAELNDTITVKSDVTFEPVDKAERYTSSFSATDSTGKTIKVYCKDDKWFIDDIEVDRNTAAEAINYMTVCVADDCCGYRFGNKVDKLVKEYAKKQIAKNFEKTRKIDEIHKQIESLNEQLKQIEDND